MNIEYLKGRGAQLNTSNPFLKTAMVSEHVEGLDEEVHTEKPRTQLFMEDNRRIVNKVKSPDLGFMYSANPYQGCEHGCVYCYARNTHEYWGFSAGLDFETKIVVKRKAPASLENYLLTLNGNKVSPIVFSGNTDCYQPMEREFKLTRRCLEILLKYEHPVSVITKNALLLRDLDLLRKLADRDLVHVYISITTLDEELRRAMEPRTSSCLKRLEAIRTLTDAGVPVGVMVAPVIPGMNDHEIPVILERASDAGAVAASYATLRLNGRIAEIFSDWLAKNFPDRFHKVIHQVADLHGGELNDHEWFRRMQGEGPIADMIGAMFRSGRKKYFEGRGFPPFNLKSFRQGGNYRLF